MDDRTKLIHRLNRSVGQIEGIEERINNPEGYDCAELIQQLKAVQGSLRHFGKALLEHDLEQCIDKLSKQELLQKLSKTLDYSFK